MATAIAFLALALTAALALGGRVCRQAYRFIRRCIRRSLPSGVLDGAGQMLLPAAKVIHMPSSWTSTADNTGSGRERENV